MRIHAITRLNKFVPAVIRLLEKNCNQEIPDILIISIVSALQKIIESIGNFLSPYLDQLLNELARLNCLYTDSQHPKVNFGFDYKLQQNIIEFIYSFVYSLINFF